MFGQVLLTEFIKLRRSKITWLTWLAFSIAPLALGLFMWILKEPDRARSLGLLGAKAEFIGGAADWATFAPFLALVTGLGGMLLTAVITAYVFGREYSDVTAKNLLALPAPRWTFVAAKLVVVGVWFGVISALVFVEGIAVGTALALPGLSWGLLARAAGEAAVGGALSFMLVPPVAWIATLGRGYLPPIGYALFTLMLGDVFSHTGWAQWFPYSILPLLAGATGPHAETLPTTSLVVLGLTFVAGVAATVWQVRNADNVQ